MDQITKADSKKDKVEVADILREHIREYQERYPLRPDQYKIVYDLLNCRTEHLGGRREKCDHCDHERILYNSCRNRHCPKCQSIPREAWILKRKAEVMPVPYFHNVFTLPHDLNSIIPENKKIMLDLLFNAASETLLTFGRNAMAGTLGFIAILHTWDQLLKPHFHLHCLVAGGAISEDGTRWMPCKNDYLFNEEALSEVFRGKFTHHLTKAYEKHELVFKGINAPFEKPEKFRELKNTLYAKKWVVYVKEPIKQPDYVLEYLGRYTHRVAISNHRILSLKDGLVTFKYKNRKTTQIEQTSIDAIEFVRRFLMHALPRGFVRIRHYGFLAHRDRTKNLEKIRRLLNQPTPPKTSAKPVEEMMVELTGIDITLCPCCKKGKMHCLSEIPRGSGLSPAHIIKSTILRETG